MSEEILINVTPRETRVAMVENGVLTELFVERSSRLGLVGNIYKGKVSRVLPAEPWKPEIYHMHREVLIERHFYMLPIFYKMAKQIKPVAI